MALEDGGGGVGVSQVPEPHRRVGAALGEGLAVGAEGHRGDGAVVALEDGGGVPMLRLSRKGLLHMDLIPRVSGAGPGAGPKGMPLVASPC